MKRTAPRLLLATGLVLAATARAEMQYITDSVTVTLRVSPVSDAKPVGNPLSTGNPVDVLQRSPDGKWARVRFQQAEGWMPASMLQKEQAARDRLAELQARFDALDREQRSGGTRSRDLEAEVQSLRASLTQAQSERDTALQQLGELRMNSVAPQDVAVSNRELNARVVALGVDNEKLRAEIDRLSRAERADFLFYGGLIVLGGMLAGWWFTRQSGRRSSGW